MAFSGRVKHTCDGESKELSISPCFGRALSVLMLPEMAALLVVDSGHPRAKYKADSHICSLLLFFPPFAVRSLVSVEPYSEFPLLAGPYPFVLPVLWE
jgi:hypothetical protein